MKKIFFAILIIISVGISAQTATLSSFTATINCPATGTAVATSSGISNPQYALIESQTNGVVGTVQNNGNFNNIAVGTYFIRVTGENSSNQPVTSQTSNFTIASNYQPISAADISTATNCGVKFDINNTPSNPDDDIYKPGGTITVNSVTGGNPGYTYLFYSGTNPSFDDSGMTYSSANTFTANSYGTYQIRIKDACGAKQTFTKTISPSLLAANDIWFAANNNVNNTCPASSIYIYNMSIYGDDGGLLDFGQYINAGGVKLEMWEQTGSCPSTQPTSVPSTPPIFSKFINSTDTAQIELPIVSSKKYLFRITTPCGEQRINCYDATYNLTKSFAVKVLNYGCSGSETMSIAGSENLFWNFPVTVDVKNNSGVSVYSNSLGTETASIWDNVAALNSWSVSNLPLDNYTVTYSDICGNVVKSIANPHPATPTVPIVENYYYQKWRCEDINPLTQTGTTQLSVLISGFIENAGNASITLNGVEGVLQEDGYYGWTNIAPGNYNIIVNTKCSGITYILPITVTPSPGEILQQSISASGVSVCDGGGNVIATYQYTGNYSNEIQLLYSNGNLVLDGGGNPVVNTSGIFNNLPAGSYKTRLKVSPWCNTATTVYSLDSNVVTLTGQQSGPAINRRMGVICEDASGNQLSYGNIYVNVSGVSPITLRYRENTSSTWTIHTTNASPSEAITNLAVGNTYVIQAIDGCGNYTAEYPTTLTPVGTISYTNTTHPCYNSPYTLSVPDYGTVQVTYEWKNQAGQVVSTLPYFQIANYTAAYDGNYTATIKLGTCVTRKVTATINGALCGQQLGACYKDPATDTNFYPSKHGITSLGRAGATQDNWPMVRQNAHTVLEANSKGFVINRLSTVQKEKIKTDGNAIEGMIVYDTDLHCLSIFNGTNWKCFNKQTCPTN